MIRTIFRQELIRVIVDDNWQTGNRDGDGRLQPDLSRFPDGIDGLASKIHDMGFKFGIYGSKYGLITFVKGVF